MDDTQDYRRIRKEWEERYPHRFTRFLAWCYLFNKNPNVAWGGNESNIEYMEWVSTLARGNTYQIDDDDYWYEAVGRKEIYEAVH